MAERFEDHGIHVVGTKAGNVKLPCPQCGHAGLRSNPRDRSLSVNVERGVWKCHYCGWKGFLKDGDRNLFGRHLQPKVYKRPEPLPAAPLTKKAQTFFAERGITHPTLDRYGVTEVDGAIKFPYTRHGELVNVKTRYPGKRFAMEADCELIFFGLDQCAPDAEQLVIVEGEPDALACAEAGIPNVLSVPNGASTGTMAYLESAETLFDGAHTVILATDADDPGRALELELARRIGKGKCCRARYPEGCKDANDLLVKYGPAALRSAIADAEEFPVDGARWLGSFAESAILLRQTQRERGSSTGWRAVDAIYTVLPGELTVLTGYPGSGKTEWLDALLMNLAQFEGWSHAVYSPESGEGDEHFCRMASKYLGKPYWPGPTEPMTDGELRAFAAWGDRRFLLLDPEHPSIPTLLGMVRSFVFRHGIRGLVIDPWNRLDHTRAGGVSLTEHVRDHLGLLSDFAKRNDLHVWLMAHPKKPEPDAASRPPTAYDISDSAHFFNMADNILVIHRDKGDDAAPVQIVTQKVRRQRVGQLGSALLRFDRLTGRYREV